MDMFTTQRSRPDNPAPKSSFQRELEMKMRERKRRGLSADISEDDDLGSDNELMDHFNLTSKSKSWKSSGVRDSPTLSDRASPANRKSPFETSLHQSPYSDKSSPYSDTYGRQTPSRGFDQSDGDVGYGALEMMKTIKSPQTMASTIGQSTPSPQRRKSKALESLDEISGSRAGREGKLSGKENKPWQPPSFSKTPQAGQDKWGQKSSPLHDTDDEQAYSHSRKSPGLLESFEDKKPKASPRLAKSGSGEGGRSRSRSPWEKEEEEDEKDIRKPKPRARVKGIFDDDNYGTSADLQKMAAKSVSSTKTTAPKPKSRSKTKSPTGRKTPTDEKSSKTKPGSLLDLMSHKEETKAPKSKKKPSLLDSDSEDDMATWRKPQQKAKVGRKSPNDADERKSPHGVDRRQSPFDTDERMSPYGGDRRKSPFDTAGGKSPVADRRRSQLDVEKKSVNFQRQKPMLNKAHFSDSEEEVGGAMSAFSPVNQRGGDQRVSRLRNKKAPSEDRDSSLCRDVDKDPSPMKHAATKEAEEIRKKDVRSHTGNSRLLETAIETIESAQAMDNTDSKRQQSTESASGSTVMCTCKQARMANSSRNKKSVKHKPQPRYAKPQIDAGATTPTEFNSTTDICSAVYQDWYKQKEERIKQQLKEKKEKEKEEEARKKKSEEEKLMEAKMSYQGWMEKKKDYVPKKVEAKKKEEVKKQKEMESKLEKLKDSETTFRMWKENKDALLREKERKKKRAEEEKRQDEQDKKIDREKHSKTAFRGWNDKKEVVLKTTLTSKQQEERKKEQEKLREEHRREREALQAYQGWLDKKERQEGHQRRLNSARSTDERPAWSPAGRTIPTGR